MEREQHIELLKKAIQENEHSLAKMKTVVAEMEEVRLSSRARHNQPNLPLDIEPVELSTVSG